MSILMLPSWFSNKSSGGGTVCSTHFPQMWSSFVDHWVDYAFVGRCAAQPPHTAADIPSVLPAPERLVAIGDFHGDYDKARRAFRLAGLTDKHDNWVAKDTVCVQVGDILDRGDSEMRTLYFLERLQQEAKQAGSQLHVLNGNHETMNIMGDFRYATSGSTEELQEWHRWQRLGSSLKSKCNCQAWDRYRKLFHKAIGAMDPRFNNPWRTGAVAPGGPVTERFFLRHPMVLQVGSTVFVHGGVLPQHVDYGLERINRETQEWMAGTPDGVPPRRPPDFLRGVSAIVWARDYSAEDRERCDCEKLKSVLESIPGAERMVVGHTIQRGGINAACDGQVLRVDVGMSRGCGDREVEVLEILNDSQVRRLREHVPPEELPQKEPPSAPSQPAGSSSWPPLKAKYWRVPHPGLV